MGQVRQDDTPAARATIKAALAQIEAAYLRLRFHDERTTDEARRGILQGLRGIAYHLHNATPDDDIVATPARD